MAGLTYALVRQLRRRRALPPHRYRGPSVVLMLVLALCLTTAATVPFFGDVDALFVGGGEVSGLGGFVILTSTQAALLLVTWLFVVIPRAFPRPFVDRPPRWLPALAAGIGWGIVAWVGAAILAAIAAVLLDRAGIPPDPQISEHVLFTLDPVLIVFAVVILAPIAEEIFFRGLVFNAWLRERGRRFAYLASAALFALIHGSLAALLPILGLGLALAWVYRRARTLVAPIAMHATVNAISVTIALLARYGVISLPS